jgi:hypothetical protein
MTAIATARISLANTIADGCDIPCSPFIPPRLTTPSGFVSPASPWLADSGEFGYVRVNFQVDLVVATATNEVITEALDTLAEDALVSLINDRWFVDSISAPYSLEANNASYLAVTVTVGKNIKL